MGIYFCRVGTDDGADTEPATGSEVQAGRAVDCSARVSVNLRTVEGTPHAFTTRMDPFFGWDSSQASFSVRIRSL
jgi:hypothetical protein